MNEMNIQPAAEAAPGLSPWQRVVCIFSAPSKTFAQIQRGDRSWWLPLLIFAVVGYLFFAAVIFRIGLRQVVTNQIHLKPAQESQLSQLPPEQQEKNIKIAVEITEAIFIANPVLVLAGVAVLSGGLWATINFVFGGRAKYGSIFTVWMYAALPGIVKPLLGAIAIFAGVAPESFNIKNYAPTNIGAFLDPLATNKAIYTLATSLDAVTIWTMVLLGMGTALVAGVRRSSGYFAVFGWWALFVLIGVSIAAAFG